MTNEIATNAPAIIEAGKQTTENIPNWLAGLGGIGTLRWLQLEIPVIWDWWVSNGGLSGLCQKFRSGNQTKPIDNPPK